MDEGLFEKFRNDPRTKKLEHTHITSLHKAMLVKRGKIIAEGSPEKVSTVKESYTGKFIKEIIGTGSMKKTA